MNYFRYFSNLFCSPKILPSSELDINQESITIKQEKEETELEEKYIIPSSSNFPLLKSVKKTIMTSFYSSYNYSIIYIYIYKILLPYDPYFDCYENYWLIINKKYKKHTSIKISLYKFDENIILIECYSMDRDDKFWKIYYLLKKKCNNVKKQKLMEFCESNFDEI